MDLIFGMRYCMDRKQWAGDLLWRVKFK
jgi:hypothetical protein